MGDKRTKEVFALYPERITAHEIRGFAPRMDALDDGLSTPRIPIRSFQLLHALQRCMSGSGLFPLLPNPYAGRTFRATGLQVQAAIASLATGAPSFGWIGASVHHLPCSLTLVFCSFATSFSGRRFLQRPFLCGFISCVKLLVSYNMVGISHLPSLCNQTYSLLHVLMAMRQMNMNGGKQ
ncbi:hypothetical protein [Pseudomonas sp. NFACC45]|uniref:hypothetical protein n=1 Tax=Pseudomonas sp. NFACC45 TaxID=1566201 RepID=UPI000B80CE41|nr:hypothetical protein [Pseudomonas sp. NFACC45]